MYDYSGSTALITGASRGIGAEIARELAARGAPTLILVARSREDLERLAEELYATYQTRVEVIAADLAEPDAPERIKEETDRRGLHVDLLVNNAGFGYHGYFEESEMEREGNMVAVNAAAPVKLTRLYLPEMTARQGGAIVNIASTAAFQPVPFMATYGATKAFVLSFSEALRVENEAKGVRIVCVCPGGVETGFDFGTSKSRGRFENTRMSSPEEVAAASLEALEKNASCTVVGTMNYIGTFAPRLLPRTVIARITGAIFRPLSEQPDSGGSRRKIVAGAAFAVALGAAALVAVRRGRQQGEAS